MNTITEFASNNRYILFSATGAYLFFGAIIVKLTSAFAVASGQVVEIGPFLKPIQLLLGL